MEGMTLETPTPEQVAETIERRVPEGLQAEGDKAGECHCRQCEHIRLVQAGFRIEHLERELQALREAVRRVIAAYRVHQKAAYPGGARSLALLDALTTIEQETGPYMGEQVEKLPPGATYDRD